jgi:hypothetical protein
MLRSLMGAVGKEEHVGLADDHEFELTSVAVGAQGPGRIYEDVSIPVPDGGGWDIVSTVAVDGRIYWTWRRRRPRDGGESVELPSPPPISDCPHAL